jgi:enterobacterial common antigen flippase
VITARSLGPSGRGTLAAIIMWPQFLSYLLTLGIPLASVYYLRRDPENARSYAAAATLLSFVMGCFAVVVGYFVIPYSLHAYDPSVVRFAQLAVCMAPLALLGVTLSIQAQSAGEFRLYNSFRVAQPVAVLVLLFVAWKLHFMSYSSAALIYLFAGVPITIWNGIWVWSYFKPSFKNNMPSVRRLLGYGVRVWGADLLGTVANQVDRVLVVSTLQPHDMGLYVVAQSVAGLMNVLPNAMTSVLMPRAAGRSTEEIVSLTGRALRVILALLVLVALALFFLGGILLSLVYGNKFDGATPVLRILLGEAILDGMTSVLSQAFLAAGIPGVVTLLQGCGLLTAVPLLFWMVPRYGLKGAAFALLISTSFRLTFVLLSFPMRLKVAPPRLLLRLSDIREVMRQR